ncbi:PREDICTED: uncharacterized protein LOC105459691 [Wasmannia auropunctata]|uniref:uncharacterized protein LOC105459691 n=1 Tax=Wasmannia auropunctata TaxID=64793 RepID=UPI0005EEBC00|nr:PREDICTED: uncharacterized protein LOC105459691 [Wasmannia auropunctata]
MSITAQYKNRKYDMQVLLKLILTYNIYVGFVIYEVLSFPKSCTVFAINAPNYKRNVSIADSNNEFKSNERRYYSDIYSQFVSPLHSAPFTTGKPKVDIARQIRTLTPLDRHWKRSTERNFRLYFQTSSDLIYGRKLLGYERDFSGSHPTRRGRSNGKIHREITPTRTSGLMKRKRNVIAQDIDSSDDDIDSAAWDNWSIWSACSVSCGQGRQVRWRHCSSADCIEGLKKAQLRSCHLKDCSTKGFLGWLGIKS